MPLDFNKITKLSAPTLLNGKWLKPQMSKKDIRIVKKLSLIAGAPWQDPPSVVLKPKPIAFVQRKGVKHDRMLEQRINKTKELLQGQLKQWAEKNKVRRDAVKQKEKVHFYDFNDFYNPHYTTPQIPKYDAMAWEERLAKEEAKEKHWATLLKGSTGPAKKLSAEEKLAKRRAEKGQKKKEKAAKAASPTTPTSPSPPGSSPSTQPPTPTDTAAAPQPPSPSPSTPPPPPSGTAASTTPGRTRPVKMKVAKPKDEGST